MAAFDIPRAAPIGSDEGHSGIGGPTLQTSIMTLTGHRPRLPGVARAHVVALSLI